MSITNLQQTIHNGQLLIYNYPMPIYDADKFADWLTEAFARSRFKSFSALADEAGLSRSSVSALANAKKQSLTDKPSQPKPETVINLAKALNEDVNRALTLAGHAQMESSMESYDILDVANISFQHKKLTKAQQERILDVMRTITQGVLAEQEKEEANK